MIKNYKKAREPETPKVKKKPEDNNFQIIESDEESDGFLTYYYSLLNKMGRNDEMIRLIGYHSMNNPIQIWRLINRRNNPHKRIKKH